MFGIIYMLGSLCVNAVGNIKETYDNYVLKSKQKNDSSLTWTDIRGRDHLKSNGHLAMYGKGNKQYPNDYVLMDIDTGKVIKNYSQEDRKRNIHTEYEKSKKLGHSTYCCDLNRHYYDEVRGERYKDFKTGNIYVIRNFGFDYYYIDINTGEIIRRTDHQIRKDEEAIRLRCGTISRDRGNAYVQQLKFNKNHSKFYNEYYNFSCPNNY